MRKFVLALAAMAFVFTANCQQSPIGTWITVDDETGEEKSHLQIYEEEGKLSGKIVRLLKDDSDALCQKCPKDRKNKPVLGMIILRDLKEDDGEWTGGYILDPERGKEYKCQISLVSEDRLEVRGYIGLPAFGRSQLWKRVK